MTGSVTGKTTNLKSVTGPKIDIGGRIRGFIRRNSGHPGPILTRIFLGATFRQIKVLRFPDLVSGPIEQPRVGVILQIAQTNLPT